MSRQCRNGKSLLIAFQSPETIQHLHYWIEREGDRKRCILFYVFFSGLFCLFKSILESGRGRDLRFYFFCFVLPWQRFTRRPLSSVPRVPYFLTLGG